MRYVLIFCVLAFLYANIANAATVVFVASEEQNSKAIKSIVRGIKKLAADARILPVDDLYGIIDTISVSDDRLILLGSRLVSQSAQIQNDLLAIGGGFYEPLENDTPIPVIPLDPATETIVEEIAKTGFQLSRLITVTANQSLKTHLDLSADELMSAGIELDVRLSEGERGIARSWFEVLRDIDPKTDALLISDATYLESSGTYKTILETAWRQNLLVVSALPKYAERGVSIGFIPDLVGYGSLLVETVEALERSSENVIDPIGLTTKTLIRVFNQRTLEYIGYSLPEDIDQLIRVDIVIE